ncbi:MAG: di-trans,poly-cis-decaprenylcistransferase [Bacteroidales bacterium]|nr:di-trans,poly-cis-decaprenylcistransferase [Bacteroidales bacterium]MBR6933463.1 di-trans,poly-cis-decaprenylcistransferase [Bacteroidales bacterium]
MDNTTVPRHVSIIMDGNGRWAKERGKERVFGHLNGVKSVRACTEAAVEEGVRYLSLFAFSEENWSRPESEVSALMDLMMVSIRKEVRTLMDNGVRFVVLGNRSRLSERLNASIDALMEETAGNERMTLIIFLSYSGKWDILQAAKALAKRYAADPEGLERVGISDFDSYLVTAGIPDPDLLIRTSGEQRISNYLLWQTAYTEFYFSDVLWPDFRKKEFRKALRAYSKRDRRYGKVK